MGNKIVMYTDGCYRPLTSRSSWGFHTANLDYCLFGGCKAKSSIAAELIAIIRAIKYARFYKKITIFTDCEIVVNKCRKREVIKNHSWLCLNLYNIMQSKKVTIIWVSREHNKLADSLARQGL